MSLTKRAISLCLAAALASGCSTLPRFQTEREDRVCEQAEMQAKEDTPKLRWGLSGALGLFLLLSIPLMVAAKADSRPPQSALEPYQASERQVYEQCYSNAQIRDRQTSVWKGFGVIAGTLAVAFSSVIFYVMATYKGPTL